MNVMLNGKNKVGGKSPRRLGFCSGSHDDQQSNHESP